MKTIIRALLASVAALAAVIGAGRRRHRVHHQPQGRGLRRRRPAPAAHERARPGARRSRWARRRQLAVMYIQSGKEYVLKGPATTRWASARSTPASGMPPAARETAWRANSEVLVKVAQTSSASIRMRSIAPAKPDGEGEARLPDPRRRDAACSRPFAGRRRTRRRRPTSRSPSPAGRTSRSRRRRSPARATASREAAARHGIRLDGIRRRRRRSAPPGSARFPPRRSRTPRSAARRRRRSSPTACCTRSCCRKWAPSQEAQEAWGKLAQERTDLPELAEPREVERAGDRRPWVPSIASSSHWPAVASCRWRACGRSGRVRLRTSRARSRMNGAGRPPFLAELLPGTRLVLGAGAPARR